MPRTCRECGQNTGLKRWLCKPCTLEARETREATTPLQTDAGQNVGTWIRTGETWHASVAFDGYEHEFACRDTFTDFPAADASIDHHALAHEHVCPVCRAAIDAESMPEPWKRAVADGGTVQTPTEQQKLTPTDDTPEPRSNSTLDREWNGLRKHADVNHESRPWETTHCDHDTDADWAYELIVSWTSNFLMAADAAYEWDRFTAVWSATEADDEREIRTDGGQSSSGTVQTNRRKSVQPQGHSFPVPIGRNTSSGSSREAIAFPQFSQIATVFGRFCNAVIDIDDRWINSVLNRTRRHHVVSTHLLTAIFQRLYRTLHTDTDRSEGSQ